MANNPISNAIRRFRGAEALRAAAEQTDGHLLTRFLHGRDEAAFEALVRRHGPMVLGVCRRVLRNDPDAEDAFQATFLVLARKAASVVPRDMVGNWLYGVAYNTALKARAGNAKRRSRERQVKAIPEPAAARPDQDLWSDLQPLLDQELSRLPDKYRYPVVLCDLEGKTHKEAAGQLGCPEGTLSVRLSRARALLAKRLALRGLALSAGSLAAVLAQNAASACVPAPLVGSTVQAAAQFAAGQAAAGGLVSARVTALSERVIETMWLTTFKAVALLFVLLVVVGLTCQIHFEGPDDDPAPKTARLASQDENRPKGAPGLKELQGEWKVVALELDGEKASVDEVKGMRWTFKGSKLWPADPGKMPGEACSVKVDTSKNPRHIDLVILEGEKKGTPIPGIYKLEVDRLTVCHPDEKNVGKGRPTEFTARKGSGQGLIVMERVKEPIKPTVRGQEKPRKDAGLKELEGEWKVVTLEVEAVKVPEKSLEAVRWVFEGSVMRPTDAAGGPQDKASVKIDAGKTPKHIDLVALEGPQKGKTVRGIFKIENRRLTICFRSAEAAAKGRPDEFRTAKDSGLALITLERVK